MCAGLSTRASCWAARHPATIAKIRCRVRHPECLNVRLAPLVGVEIEAAARRHARHWCSEAAMTWPAPSQQARAVQRAPQRCAPCLGADRQSAGRCRICRGCAGAQSAWSGPTRRAHSMQASSVRGRQAGHSEHVREHVRRQHGGMAAAVPQQPAPTPARPHVAMSLMHSMASISPEAGQAP